MRKEVEVELYLLRHGEAGAAALGGDEARQLTEKGRRDVQAGAELLLRASAQPETVFTSPLARARQTGEIVAEALGLASQPDDRHCPGATRRSVARLVGEQSYRRLLLVGHEPDLSSIVRQLTDGRVKMQTSAVARVNADRLEPGGGVLAWLVSPGLLPPR